MSREEAIDILIWALQDDSLIEGYQDKLNEALKMAIKALENHDTFVKYAYSQGKQDALSQEPCDDAISRSGAIKTIEEKAKRIKNEDTLNGLAGAVGILFELPSVNPQPCDDAISRILKRMWNCRGKHTTSIDKVKMEQIIRDALPSVTTMRDATPEEQKSVNDYIKSISTPTGVKFSDVVSRDAVIKAVDAHTNEDGTLNDDISVILEDLPPVNPQYMGNEFFNFDAPMVKKSMEQDTVSRQAVCNIVNDIRDFISVEGYWAILERLKKLLPVTQKLGKWIDEGWYAEGHSEHAYRCSECDEHYIGYVGEYNYCPYCGAYMAEGEGI